jgi:uncharacterized repeat protein (TIGR01451 family)
MSKFSIVILASLGMISTTFFTLQLPVQARISKQKVCVDPLPASKLVTLTLKADKQVMSEKNISSFQAIAGKASVKRGDIIMYTVVAKNNSRCPLKNLVLKQPIPKGTEYVKGSAMAIDGAELLFSIDGGKTFSPKPTIITSAGSSLAKLLLMLRLKRLINCESSLRIVMTSSTEN